MTVSICHHCGGLGPEKACVAIGIDRERVGEYGAVTSVK